MSNLIGTAPDQVPVNGMLGDMAFQDSDSVKITDLTYTGTLTGSTGILNIGSGQLYKDASGNVGIGTSNPLAKLDVSSTTLSEIRATISSVGAGNVARLALKSPVASYAWYVADNTNALVLYDYNATTERMRIDSSGNVGIGTSSPTGKLHVSGGRSFFVASSEPFAVGARYSAAGGTVYFGATDATATPGVQISAATGAALLNIDSSGKVGIGAAPAAGRTLTVSKNLTGNVTTRGVVSSGQIQSDSTSGAGYFSATSSTQAATFNVTYLEIYGASQGTFGAGSTVSNQVGFSAGSSLTGAVNNYGFYGNIASGTGRYNLYMAGTADNYLAGSLGIGSTPATGATLDIRKNITGGINSYGVLVVAQIQSDVTVNVSMYQSQPSTVASAFTLSSLRHYYATQGTIGAGSAVTSQYGFLADASLTGATNNYGFFGNIASGTGRYNLYMGGTADNYFAGNVGIGTSSPTSKFHVRSDANALTVIEQIQNRNAGASAGGVIAFINSANDLADNRYAYIGAVTSGAAENGNNLVFATNPYGGAPAERMRIDSSGNVVLKTGSLQEVKTALAALDVNISLGNYFTKTITAISTLTVSNVPATGTVASFILDLTNGGAFAITWWANMKWASGTAPTLTASGRDILGFFTHDAGTTWNGLVLAKDIK